eukprot:tig00000145_g8814.t1
MCKGTPQGGVLAPQRSSAFETFHGSRAASILKDGPLYTYDQAGQPCHVYDVSTPPRRRTDTPIPVDDDGPPTASASALGSPGHSLGEVAEGTAPAQPSPLLGLLHERLSSLRLRASPADSRSPTPSCVRPPRCLRRLPSVSICPLVLPVCQASQSMRAVRARRDSPMPLAGAGAGAAGPDPEPTHLPPVCPCPVTCPPSASPRRTSASAPPSPSLSCSPAPVCTCSLCILIADDEPLNRLVASRIFSSHCPSAHVDVVRDGQAAVEAFARGKYDAAVLDIEMPFLTGIEAARAMRRSGSVGREARLVAWSSALGREDGVMRARCAEAAAFDELLEKPCPPSTLFARTVAPLRHGPQCPFSHQARLPPPIAL